LAHTFSPDRPVTLETLRFLGVLYWSISPQNWEPEIDRIAAERVYKNRDVINVTKEGLGDLYEAKLKTFFEEWVFLAYIFFEFARC
jgi:1,2-dihydroxy-3-keto-5-methylthiopentene dioxygenase